MKYYALVGIAFLALSLLMVPVHAQISGHQSIFDLLDDPMSYWSPLSSTATTQLSTNNSSYPPNALPPNINLPTDIHLCINPANVAMNVIDCTPNAGAALHAAEISTSISRQQKPYSDINSTVPAQFAESPNVQPGKPSQEQILAMDYILREQDLKDVNLPPLFTELTLY